jgi:Raf kinase inhibitor-like YbhB/YbcL family protein
MVPRLIPVMIFAVVASCSANDHAANRTKGGAAVENTTIAKLTLSSDAFKDGQPIPARYACDGADETPVLHWSDPPPGTKSFALVIDDPDAPSGTFRHWGVYDIAASARSIGGSQRVGTEVMNDFGKLGYGGPCPPKGHGAHHYHLKLFALDMDRLNLPGQTKVADVENAANGHLIAHGELIGTYERR